MWDDGNSQADEKREAEGVKEANGNKEHNESNMALLDPHGYSQCRLNRWAK